MPIPFREVGWLVIVLTRHAEALHDLSAEEFRELGILQSQATRFLYEELHCQKEYISCYGEAENFAHIHFHVFAKPADLPEDLKGGKSFNFLKVSMEEAVPPAEHISFCKLIQDKFRQQGM